jgi:alkanesulfonate monooxygenase SsuD/methylene tetrahydromethanopterin reductase-like flavin-dependent oxidoreductase (luciferase family)
MQDTYREMTSQAQFAEDCGYVSFSVPEHHFTNALVHPSGLLTAVHVAAHTQRIPIMTATTVLPFHNIPLLAGQIAQADCLTNGRIEIGVGRGAYRYEFKRLQIPYEEARERFDDSLEFLISLLSKEDVSWDSRFYKVPPTTITPRPVQKPHPKIWFAATSPEAIEYAAGRSFPVMTTPLRESFDKVRAQADAFQRGRTKAGGKASVKLSMLIMLFVTESRQQTDAMIQHALGRHRRFANVFGGEGEVERGAIKPYDVELTAADIEKNLIIGPAETCIERLKDYEALGMDNIQLNMSFGASHTEVMRSLELFATRVMPDFQSLQRVA